MVRDLMRIEIKQEGRSSVNYTYYCLQGTILGTSQKHRNCKEQTTQKFKDHQITKERD